MISSNQHRGPAMQKSLVQNTMLDRVVRADPAEKVTWEDDKRE